MTCLEKAVKKFEYIPKHFVNHFQSRVEIVAIESTFASMLKQAGSVSLHSRKIISPSNINLALYGVLRSSSVLLP